MHFIFWINQWSVPRLLTRRLLISKHLSQWRSIRKLLQFEEYITSLFKIDQNIYIVCKTIKLETPTRKNQNTHKKCSKNTTKGITKTPIKPVIFVDGPVIFKLSPCVSQTFMSLSLLWSGHVRGDLYIEFEGIKPLSSMRSLTRIVSF